MRLLWCEFMRKFYKNMTANWCVNLQRINATMRARIMVWFLRATFLKMTA